MSKRLARVVRAFVVFVVCLAACSGDSCNCDQYEARPFPADKLNVTIPAAGQVRVTESGLDFVESQVPYLLTQVLPDGLSFCLPRDTSGNPDICIESTCTSGANGCQVDLTLDDQSINPMSPDTVEVEVTIGDVNERLNFDYDAGLFTANCYVQLYKDGSSEDTPGMVIGRVPIRIFTDQASPTKDVGVEIGSAQIDLSDVDFKIKARGNFGDTVACGGASLVRGLFRGMIEGEVQKALDGAVADIQQAQLCRQCTVDSDCPSNADCNAGVCEYAASCVPRTLGIEGRLTLSVPELESVAREPNPRADFLGKAADIAEVNTGITVGLRGGAEPVNISDCVPVDVGSRPQVGVVPASAAVTGNTRPGGGPFMLGVGIHRSVFEQALWSAWASGATCLSISGENLMALSTTTFSLVAPSLKELAGGGQPATVALVANNAPAVVLGENKVTPSGDTYTIDDPLLTLVWEDVDLHIFGHAQDRNLRLFTLRVDINLPVAAAYDGTSLVPLLGDLEESLTNIEIHRTELLAESNQQILDAVPTILAIAGPYLDIGLPDGIELPEFLGFRVDLSQDDITSVENGEFLALFAGLARTNAPFVAAANTAILRSEVRYDRVLPSGFVRPEVLVDVRGFASNPLEASDGYEYSWRVDGGLWSMYHRSEQLVIPDAILAVQGEHLIEVRARRIGEIRTADPTPAFTVITVEWDANTLKFEPLEPKAQRFAPVTKVLQPVTTPPAESRGMRAGCSSTGTSGSPLALVFVLCGMMLARRRRRRLTLLVALALLQTACWRGCQGELKTNADRYCLGAECVVEQACEVDSDCAGVCPEGRGAICEQGSCQCVNACNPGCPDDAFCCFSTSECVSFADLCVDDPNACEPGYEVGVTNATPDRDTCELVDYKCDCRPLPPVPIGWHGGQTSIDSDGTLTVVATHNKTYGDLMVGIVQPGDVIAWHSVDGVPTGEAIVGDPNGPRGGIEERGAKVGSHSAVVIDATSRIHVFYRDEDADALKWGVATQQGDELSFESVIVDETEGAGYWTSAALVGSEIHVVYAHLIDDGPSEVRHLILDAAASPAPTAPTTIFEDATAWDQKGYPLTAGAFFDLTASPEGPFLVFYNGVDDRVGRTTFDGTAWVDPAFVAAGNGPWGAGVKGADGNEHVVFMQSSGLRYSRFGDILTSEVVDGVRALAGEYWNDRIGEGPAIRVDGDVTVAYQDAFDRTLIVSQSPAGESGSWTHQRYRDEGTASGFWVAMTRRGERYIADMVVDRSSEAQAYVRVTSF